MIGRWRYQGNSRPAVQKLSTAEALAKRAEQELAAVRETQAHLEKVIRHKESEVAHWNAVVAELKARLDPESAP